MNVLVTTQPGLGHLHPLIPFARALRDVGHHVAFACARSFRSRVEALGFASIAAGLDWLEAEADATFDELHDVPPENRSWDWFVTNVFADVAARRMLPDLRALCERWTPDLILRNDYEYASCIVAEIYDIPYATVSVETFLPAATWHPIVGSHLADLRRAAGLAPEPSAEMLHRHLYLSTMPASYEMPEFRSTPTTFSVRPVLYDGGEEAELPAWFDRLPDRPIVYATLGTVFNNLTEIFQTIINGVAGEPVTLIMTVGSSQSPEQLAPLPDNVYVERYIPQSLLLPHCDVAITHCGYQTTISVLRHGLPVLAVPIGATGPLRALRYEATSAGIALRPAHLRANGPWGTFVYEWPEFGADAVRAGVRTLLDTSHYRRQAQYLRDEMLAQPSIEDAVRELERLGSRDATSPVSTAETERHTYEGRT